MDNNKNTILVAFSKNVKDQEQNPEERHKSFSVDDDMSVFFCPLVAINQSMQL